MPFDPLRVLRDCLTLMLLAATAAAQAPPIADPELECAFREVLQARDDGSREYAALRLAEGGPEGLLLLDKLSLQRRPEVRLAAARGLAARPEETSVPSLARLLLDRDAAVVRVAAAGLRAGEGAAHELLHLALLDAGAREATELQALLLGASPVPDTAWQGALVALLRHPQPLARSSALDSLATLDAAAPPLSAVSPFVVAEERAVARAAVRCLDAWLDSRTPALVRLVRDDDPYLADYGLIALRRREAPPFQSPVQDPEWSEVSAALEQALGSEHSLLRLDALRTLRAWLENSYAFPEDASWLRRVAAHLQAEPEGIVREACVRLLADAAVRRSGVEGLGGATGLTAESRSLLHYDTDDLVIPALLAALEDADEIVRRVAGESLRALFDQGADPRETWRELAGLSADERTQSALRRALRSLESGADPRRWELGLRLALGRRPPAEGDPAEWLREILAREGDATRLELLTSWDAESGIPDPLTWALLSRIAGESLHPLEFLSRRSRRSLRARIADGRVRAGPRSEQIARTREVSIARDLRLITEPGLRSTAVATVSGWQPGLHAQAERLRAERPRSAQVGLLAGLVELASAQAHPSHAREAFETALRAEEAAVREAAHRRLLELAAGEDGAGRRLRKLEREAPDETGRCRSVLARAELLLRDGRARAAERRLSSPRISACAGLLEEDWEGARLLAAGAAAEAAELRSARLARNPASPEARRALAAALEAAGREDDALRERGLAARAEAVRRAAVSGDQPELVEDAEALARLWPDSPVAAGWLGRLELQNGRLGPGQGRLERALEAGCRDPGVFLPLLRSQARVARCEAALDTLWEARRTWPELSALGSKSAQACFSRALLAARDRL